MTPPPPPSPLPPPPFQVPPELPEPALGINFARNGMARPDWLALVAVHSDAWLLAVASYNGARLNREGRDRLFELVNEVPTWRADQQPYGGLRDSGNTREGPAFTIREMTETRMVVING